MAMDDGSLGGGFWLRLIGVGVAVVIGAFLVFWLIGSAWYAWGFVGCFIFVGIVLLALGWAYDRRERKQAAAAEDPGPFASGG